MAYVIFLIVWLVEPAVVSMTGDTSYLYAMNDAFVHALVAGIAAAVATGAVEVFRPSDRNGEGERPRG